jgi:hypothetical protein
VASPIFLLLAPEHVDQQVAANRPARECEHGEKRKLAPPLAKLVDVTGIADQGQTAERDEAKGRYRRRGQSSLRESLKKSGTIILHGKRPWTGSSATTGLISLHDNVLTLLIWR